MERTTSGQFTSTQSIEDRFLAKVDKRENGCWVWTAAVDKDGYGTFVWSSSRGKLRAHRVSWELFKSTKVPALLRHTCDNPTCVNPDHLLGGSQKENIQDSISRERFPVGDKHHNAKLSFTEARRIFESEKTYSSLQEEYGVSKATISAIKSKRNWKSLHE